jgi:outer membrane protein TolC
LRVLTGQAATGAALVTLNFSDTIPEISPLPEWGLPTDWMQRRPDVRAAFLRLEAAEQRAIAASLDRLPALRLSGSVFTQALEWGDLFSEWLQSISASASQTIFAGGRKQASLKLAEAQAEERWQAYRKAVLQAGKEILDALDSEKRQREYRNHLQQQALAARSALDLARDRYANGAADFLRVLNAEQSWQQLELSLIESRRNDWVIRGQLLRALGDGAENPLALSHERNSK